MPVCTILVGLPAAGKSTYISQQPDAIYVASSDAIIERLALERNMTYSEIFSEVIAEADAGFVLQIKEFCDAGLDFYVDRTNLNKKSRRRILDILTQYKYYDIRAVVFQTPDQEEWDRRLDSRPGKIIPKNVLAAMANSFTIPDKEEGFSQVVVYKNRA